MFLNKNNKMEKNWLLLDVINLQELLKVFEEDRNKNLKLLVYK